MRVDVLIVKCNRMSIQLFGLIQPGLIFLLLPESIIGCPEIVICIGTLRIQPDGLLKFINRQRSLARFKRLSAADIVVVNPEIAATGQDGRNGQRRNEQQFFYPGPERMHFVARPKFQRID